uniref:Transmembrane protein 184C n=1 Tax=Entomoneis paludosa TaxID=265537 RepID=A0A7S2Y7V7_9STRA
MCVVPVVTYHGLRLRRVDSAAFRSAGVMCVGTIVLSLRLVYLHLTHWYMPEVQKYVVRILWMVPLYSIQSWLSLRFHESRIYIDTIRDYYEAYVIASFVYYLIELLGGEAALIQILQAKASTQEATKLGKHSFPLSLVLEDWVLGEDFMLNCKHGVLQYVVFKSISAFVTFICESAGVYGEGTFTWLSAYPYLAFFQNFSVMYALYSLVMLYSAVHEELRYPINWRPLGKFLCVKGVVFFTWWQGVVIYYLKAHGIIDHLGSWSSEDVANGLIDYCVVIEMVGFAIAHSYTFTYKEYLPSNIPSEFRNMTAESLAAPFVDENGVQSPSDTTFEPQILANGDGLLAGNMGEKRHYARAESASEDGREMYQQQPEPSPISPIMGQRTTTYHPPALLDQPMDFRDAFWSSAVPKDTIQDIQRLRIAGKFEAALRPRVFSSSQESGEASGENNEENETDTEEGREDKQAPLQNEGEEEEKASEVDDSEAGSKLDEDTAGTGNQPNESYDLGEQSDQQPPIE